MKPKLCIITEPLKLNLDVKYANGNAKPDAKTTEKNAT